MLNCIQGECVGVSAELQTRARRRKYVLHRLQAHADGTSAAAQGKSLLHADKLRKGLLALPTEVQLPTLLSCIEGDRTGVCANLRTRARWRRQTLHRLLAQADGNGADALGTSLLHANELRKGLLALPATGSSAPGSSSGNG